MPPAIEQDGMGGQHQCFKAPLSLPGMKWNDHMSHRDEKWEGEDRQWETEQRVGRERKQSVSFLEEYFRGVNGAELHSSSSLNLPRCLILCMQSMKPRRQRKQRAEETSFRTKQHWINRQHILLVHLFERSRNHTEVSQALRISAGMLMSSGLGVCFKLQKGGSCWLRACRPLLLLMIHLTSSCGFFKQKQITWPCTAPNDWAEHLLAEGEEKQSQPAHHKLPHHKQSGSALRRRSLECSKNTCLERSAGERVHWQQVMVWWWVERKPMFTSKDGARIPTLV